MSDSVNNNEGRPNAASGVRPGTTTTGIRPTSSMGGRIDNVLQVDTQGGFILKTTNDGGARPKTPMPALNFEVINRRREAENRREEHA
jgi:hypothetical protein